MLCQNFVFIPFPFSPSSPNFFFTSWNLGQNSSSSFLTWRRRRLKSIFLSCSNIKRKSYLVLASNETIILILPPILQPHVICCVLRTNVFFLSFIFTWFLVSSPFSTMFDWFPLFFSFGIPSVSISLRPLSIFYPTLPFLLYPTLLYPYPLFTLLYY